MNRFRVLRNGAEIEHVQSILFDARGFEATIVHHKLNDKGEFYVENDEVATDTVIASIFEITLEEIKEDE